MRSWAGLFFSFCVTTLAFGAPPRVTYVRVIPAPESLGGAEEVALVSALGDTLGVEVFVEHLIEQTNRSGTLRMHDVRDQTHAFVLDHLRKSVAADAFLVVRAFTCTSEDRGGEGSARDADGKRTPLKVIWVETRCTARIEALTSTGGRLTFGVKGDGKSARGTSINEDAREDAVMHAARFAAIDAAEKITPRRIRETILLDESVPAFDEAFGMIANGNLADARALWMGELRRNSRSAALHFNLGALSEALGDPQAAERHYNAAEKLAPKEKRYAAERKSFLRRTAAIRR
jgi:hypothetical protein